MQSTRGKTWRHGLFAGSSGRTEAEGDIVSSDPPVPEERRQSGQRVWAVLCPNPLCDTELVIFPEYAGATVECPACGFAFLAPRVVPLQIASDSEGEDGPAPPRPFAPGAVMARPGPPAPPRPTRPAAPPPKPPETKPKVATAEVAAQIARSSADGTQALEALARGVGGDARPPAAGTSGQGGTDAAASKPPTAAAGSAASAEALRALAQAAAGPGSDARRKRTGRGTKGAGLSAQLASAAFEGERRRSTRMHMAGDPAAARKAMDRSAGRTPPASDALPLSEGERIAARRQRTDLVVTWAVAAVVSAGLTLAAYVTGVPDIGLGSLLFLGLAGARTWWLTRTKKPGGSPPP
ncbi:MAG: hypothetical protein R6X20_17295 [Phycisphaerae bacterium]